MILLALNALTNPSGNTLAIPVGASGMFEYHFFAVDSTLEGNDIIFVVFKKDFTQNKYPSLRKDFSITKVADGTSTTPTEYSVTCNLLNTDTEKLNPGSYYWDLIIKIDSEDSDDIYPIFATTGSYPEFVAKGASNINE